MGEGVQNDLRYTGHNNFDDEDDSVPGAKQQQQKTLTSEYSSCPHVSHWYLHDEGQ